MQWVPAGQRHQLQCQLPCQHRGLLPGSLQPPWVLRGPAEAAGVAHSALHAELQLGSELPLLACDRPAGKAGMVQGRPKEILSVTASVAEVLGLYHVINFTAECCCDQEIWKSWSLL